MLNNKENKRGAFVRIAQKRTNAVIDKIRILSNCSNRYYYEYSDEDVKKIFSAIEDELKITKARFMQSKSTKEVKNFSLE